MILEQLNKNVIQPLLKIIKEDIIGSDNRLIAGAWLTCLVGIVGMSFYLSSESMSFLGIADSRELQVNFEYPVEVKRVHVIAGQSVVEGDLLIELERSENKRGEEIEAEKRNKYVFAKVTGVVGAVNFKQGEVAPPFSSLLTLNPRNPGYVEGFIHESLKTRLQVGSIVIVSPVTSSAKPVEGRVVSVGARIIAMPTRLTRSNAVSVYGRETVIELPEENGFLVGEKVQIKPKFEMVGFPTALASNFNGTPRAFDQEIHNVRLPKSIAEKFTVEPSGLVYLKDLHKFLVVSDDTTKKHKPYVFLMNPDGEVDEEALRIPDVDKLADLESISTDGGRIYVLASQSLNGKGRDKESRNLFVRFKRDGLDFSDVESLALKPLLLHAIKKSTDAKVKELLEGFDEDMVEIESHMIEGGDLYLGLKGPLVGDGEDESVILKVANVNSMFSQKEIRDSDFSVFRSVKLTGNGFVHRLTDLTTVDGRMYATSACDDKKCGAVWRLPKDAAPEMLAFYQGIQPEGLAGDPKTQTLMVTFDSKKKGAKYTRVSLKGVVE